MATFMYKILNKKVPSYLDIYQRLCDNTIYNLRGQDTKLVFPKPRTEFLKKSFAYNGVKIWNSLPELTRKSETLSKFRLNLKSYNAHQT